ncbi:uncharacterized protein DUF1206 [Sphingomonas sp. F9_3S_D5_B_2]
MRAEPKYEGKFQWLARLGFLVRGALYIVIGVLVLGTGRTEDLTGALEYLNRGFGRGLLIVMIVGMTGYGLWRLADAAFGMDSGTDGGKAWRRRIAAGGSGAIYSYLAYKAARLITDGHEAKGGAQDNAATALHLPHGQLVLAVAAAVLAGAGLVQLYKVGTCSFLRHLDERARQGWAKWLGRAGYAARGVTFLTVGFLLARAALDGNPAEAGGLEQALDALHGPLEYAVAAGLMLFGVYSLVEARYRSIHRPPTENIESKLRESLPTG